MVSKRNCQTKSHRCKHDDEDNRERERLRYHAKKTKLAQTQETIVEDVNRDLCYNVDEMDIKIEYKNNKLKLKRPLLNM